MNIPCNNCVGKDFPEKFSTAFQEKSECFKIGWHIHKNGEGLEIFQDEDSLFSKKEI